MTQYRQERPAEDLETTDVRERMEKVLIFYQEGAGAP